MKAIVYTFVHSHNVCDTVDTELSDRPFFLFCNSKLNTVKDFRKVLISMHDAVRCANGFWKFGLETGKHIWSMPSFVVKKTRLRILQWKILQTIYPTNISLCRMKVRDA